MSTRQNLIRKVNELQSHYELLSEKISLLREDYAIETDTLVKFRLKHQIKQTENEREEIEKQLELLEAQDRESENKTKNNPLYPSRIINNYEELKEFWKILKEYRSKDDLDFPPSNSEKKIILNIITMTQKRIDMISDDLIDYIKLIKLTTSRRLWTLEDVYNWKKRIKREIVKRHYCDTNREEETEAAFRVASDLLSECWSQVLRLIDCLELPAISQNL